MVISDESMKTFAEALLKVLSPVIQETVRQALEEEQRKKTEQVEDKLLTRKEAARLFGVCPATLTNWQKANPMKIKNYGGPGRKLRYKESELRAVSVQRL